MAMFWSMAPIAAATTSFKNAGVWLLIAAYGFQVRVSESIYSYSKTGLPQSDIGYSLEAH
jgi:hypothetical protein